MQIVKSRAVPKEGEDLYREEGRKEATMIELFGKWQTEEWQPPRAVGGIVPRVSTHIRVYGTCGYLGSFSLEQITSFYFLHSA